MPLEMLTYQVAEHGAAGDETPATQTPERLDKGVSPAKMKALRKIAQTALDTGTVFETTARVGPVAVHLKTNEYNLFQLWRRNWPSAETEERPDGSVVAAVGLENEEPAAYLCRQNSDVTLLNVQDYGECRHWTLSLAAERAARKECAGIQAAAMVLGGRGTIIACPDAAALAACAIVLGLDYEAAIRNLTWSWLAPGGTDTPAMAEAAEATACLPPAARQWEPRLGALAGGCALSGLSKGPRQVPVQQFVMLELHEDGQQECSCEPVSATAVLGALRKGHWASPQLALPPAPGYETALEASIADANCMRARLAPGAVRPLCEQLASALSAG
jgi:hypothetical protein